MKKEKKQDTPEHLVVSIEWNGYTRTFQDAAEAARFYSITPAAVRRSLDASALLPYTQGDVTLRPVRFTWDNDFLGKLLVDRNKEVYRNYLNNIRQETKCTSAGF